MTILRKATEAGSSEWLPVPAVMWRWEVGEPSLEYSSKFNNYQVKFPLTLTEAEKKRLEDEYEVPEGKNQSWRVSYYVGSSLGWIKDGVYQTTKMVDFLAACFGSTNAKPFREWIATGGGPDTSKCETEDGAYDEEAEREVITKWLQWWTGLEVYGTISHSAGEGGKVHARFAGPLPIGSLPGQKDDEYQAHGRGKLRAIKAMSVGAVVDMEVPAQQEKAREYDEIFSQPTMDAVSPKEEEWAVAGDPVTDDDSIRCEFEGCGVALEEVTMDGKHYTVETWARATKRQLGGEYCLEHAKQLRGARTTAAA